MNFDYSTPIVIVSAIAVLLLIIVVIAIAVQHRSEQTKILRKRFGPEYDFVLSQSASRRHAEARLLARQKRVQQLKIHDLTQNQKAHYLAAWETVQSRFIDHPRGAVVEADELVTSLMQARGFSVERIEQRAADLSVDHSRVVEPYRSACGIAARAGKNNATTEELRTAMIHYRALVDDLLQLENPLADRELYIA